MEHDSVSVRDALERGFEDTPDQQEGRVRSSPIEAKDEFICVGRQVLPRDAAVVGAEQPSFEKSESAVDAWQLDRGLLETLLAAARNGELDPFVIESEPPQSPVSMPSIGANSRAATHRPSHEGRDRRRRGADGHRQPQSSRSPSLALDGAEHNDLFRAQLATTETFLASADDRLVRFDEPRERRSATAIHQSADLVEPSPGGLVIEAKQARDLQRRASALAGDEAADDPEPEQERFACAVKESPRRERDLVTAGRALVAWSRRQPPATPATASRADKAIGPPQPSQVLDTVALGRKPPLELQLRTREIHAASLKGSLDDPPDTTGSRRLSEPESQFSRKISVRSVRSVVDP